MLAELLNNPALWRGDALAPSLHPGVPTGYAELDAELPGGGWPVGTLTEVLPNAFGIGELRLLAPALARLSAQGRTLAWIAPPYQPYAPALAAAGIDLARLLIVHASRPQDTLWATEQALRGRACGAVLAWPARLSFAQLRRLQLAAQEGRALAWLFRPPEAAAEASPAPLRLSLQSQRGVPLIDIFKRRGRPLAGPLLLPALALRHALDRPPSAPSAPPTVRQHSLA